MALAKANAKQDLKKAQDSRDISEFASRQGAAALLDFLHAERSYRSTQLAYRQHVRGQRLAVGVRTIP